MKCKWFIAFLVALPLGAQSADTDSVNFFEMNVRPVLHLCAQCHSDQNPTSGLSLESRQGVLKGGIRGPAVISGKPDESTLIRAIEHSGDLKMPPGSKLSANQVASLRKWVESGVPWPDGGVSRRQETKAVEHWAFRAPARPPQPQVKNSKWVRNPIDAFILARLENEGLEPSPEADRVTLIRRLHLDLLGLPPSPADMDAFVEDRSPDAYERLVDRLLESPHYGERWARHWLDVARYADTNGFGIDGPRVAWRYRDWVIQALNRDLPFNEFVIEQLAGDLLPNATMEQRVATGYHRNTMLNKEGGVDPEQWRIESIFDRVANTGVVFLGLTLGCAQCHDHKYDPVTQIDYYRMFAFLNNQNEPVLTVVRPAEVERYRRLATEFNIEKLRLQAEIARREAETVDLLKTWERNLTAAERKELPPNVQLILNIPPGERKLSEADELEKFYNQQDEVYQQRLQALQLLVDTPNSRNPNQYTALVLEEVEQPRETHVFVRGDFLKPGIEVSPGVPGVLPGLEAGESPRPNRLDLARWIVSDKNPLTARVTINRIWQRHFGRGIVSTPENFGTQGEPPSHPELLDWLATEFVRQGWSLKAMHRLMVNSAAYRQSSNVTERLRETDPENILLARAPRLRVEAEVVRDVALSVSGLLNPKVGGPSVFPPQPTDTTLLSRGNMIWPTDTGENRYRRAMYTFLKRTSPYPSLTIFDAPTADETTTRRIRSTTPMQALTILNDELFVEMAQSFAMRLLREIPDNDAARLNLGFRLCVAREPDAFEKDTLNTLLATELERFKSNPDGAKALLPAKGPRELNPQEFAAWFGVARTLLLMDETRTRE
jgi:hypothetical protein